MKICIVGPGRIGSNLAQRFAQAGHDVVTTFARDAGSARSAPASASISFESDGRTAVRGAQVVVVAVPWDVIDDALASIGGDAGDAVIVDATNPFAPSGVVALPSTSASYNERRFGSRHYAKAFNTLTAAFQTAAIDRPSNQRSAMFFVASDAHARRTVEPLIEAVGFVPIYVGEPADSEIMEAPRRPNAVYGEEYAPNDARAALAAYSQRRNPSSEQPRTQRTDEAS